jgi:hypothetical protein
MACETDTITAPAHWASYLVNGDASSFDYYNTPSNAAGDRDKALCDAWLETLSADGWSVCSAEGEAYFTHNYPYFARDGHVTAGDVLEYTIIRSK